MPYEIERELTVQVHAGDVLLEGDLVLPADAAGVVLFAHGSGSSRHSSRNRQVARQLNERGLGTLLLDLLTAAEEHTDRITAHLRFDIPLLARRLAEAVAWLQARDETRALPIGLFGASTGAGAALIAAAQHPEAVRAVVSRGGRPDLAGAALPRVHAPTLLLVGERDYPVIVLNEEAQQQMRAETRLEIVPGATHLFEEPGALDAVAERAGDWFARHLTGDDGDGAGGDGAERRPASLTGRRRPKQEGGREPVHVYRSARERAALIGEAAEPFEGIDRVRLDALLERIGDARVVLLGEASHGTSEFYRMRQCITQALIREKGFTIVGAEADWPDAEHIDEYVRHRPGRDKRVWQAFSRFPTWMWRNHEVLTFVEWVRAHNERLAPDDRVGFYGLDMYSMYTSIEEVLRYLQEKDPELARLARTRFQCLMPFAADPARYGQAVVNRRYRDCEDEVAELLSRMLQQRITDGREAGERFFDALQNARVVASAEQYYRVMYYGSPDSWNLRDGHMFDTLKALLDFRGPDARAVVWAHNSHIGDAGYTEMGTRGEINIGHLARQAFGDDAYLIGFGTHTGTVAAASDWGAEVEIMTVRPSHRESYERLCHDSGVERFFLPLRKTAHAELRPELSDPRLERAIGVIYRPETELQSHYFRAVLPEQFDEYVWFDTSRAVRPIGTSRAPDLPERHPFLLAD